MPPHLATASAPQKAPGFYVMEHQPPRPAALLLAVLTAACAILLVSLGLGHSKATRRKAGSFNATRSPVSTPVNTPSADEDKDDDPSQIDTIVLGDAADAPVPARRTDHVSNVHATIIVHLPRFGEQVGLIPDTPAGRLLYAWLAAFNQASYPALAKALPNAALASTVTAQMELRQGNGGFNLLSAREVQPGVLVFRLHDQAGTATEVLGTLQVRPNSSPAAIASLSLRAVLPSGQHATASPDANLTNATR